MTDAGVITTRVSVTTTDAGVIPTGVSVTTTDAGVIPMDVSVGGIGVAVRAHGRREVPFHAPHRQRGALR
jgi:hypothetical protein